MRTVLVLVLLVLIAWTANATAKPKRVLVAGGGINGASFSRFLRDLSGDEPLEIHIAEPETRLGGRMEATSVRLTTGEDVMVELGASVFHTVNRYMKGFADEMGAKLTRPYLSSRGGVWDGIDGAPLPFAESSWKTAAVASALWRYQMDLVRLPGCVELLVDRLDKLYTILLNETFPSAEAMLERVDLLEPTTKFTLRKLVTSEQCGISENGAILDELVHGLVRLNYGQHYEEINAFAGMVALKGRGDEVFGIDGGNEKLVEHVVGTSKATVHFGCSVTEADSGRSSSVGWVLRGNGCVRLSAIEDYDAIAIAYPRWSIKSGPGKLPMKVTVASFVQGVINASKFGSTEEDLPTILMTSKTARLGLNNIRSIGQIVPPVAPSDEAPNGHAGLYKIFSDEPLNDDDLCKMFTCDRYDKKLKRWRPHAWVLYVTEWRGAYPDLSHTRAATINRPFVLRPGGAGNGPLVVDANALEAAVSTMETQCIGAMNAARITNEYLFGGSGEGCAEPSEEAASTPSGDNDDDSSEL